MLCSQKKNVPGLIITLYTQVIQQRFNYANYCHWILILQNQKPE